MFPSPDSKITSSPVRFRNLGVVGAAKSATRQELEAKSVLRIYEPDTPVWSENDPFVVVLQSGRCKQQIILPNGDTSIIDFFKSGDVAGLVERTAQSSFATLYVASSTVSGIVVPLAVFQAAISQDECFRQAVFCHISTETLRLRQRLFEMSSLPIQARVASYLLTLSQNSALKHEIQDPLTHEELGAYVGSNREAVTRTLRQFAKQGIVDYSRRRIKILNLSALRAMIED